MGRITVTVLGDVEKAVNLLGKYSGMKVLGVKGETINAETSGGLDELAAVNADLVGKGIKVIGLAQEKTSLEDLFMEISGSGE